MKIFVTRVVRITLYIGIALCGWSVAEAADEPTLRYGNTYHIQNQYGTKSYLDTRGAKCQNNVYCVSTATSSNRSNNSSVWKIMSATGHADGEVVRVNDLVYLQNQYGSKSYLDARGAGCKGNIYCVSTAISNNRDNNSGTWRIISTVQKLYGSPLTVHEPVHFQNQYALTSYLDVRGAGCQSNVYCVSTAASNNRDNNSGTWVMIKHGEDARISALNAADFVVYGDMPDMARDKKTQRYDWELLDNAMIPYLQESSTLPFIIHVGNLGQPEIFSEFSACHHGFRQYTLDQWVSINKAVFYTPGGNDWTDCQPEHSPEINPLGELQNVRSMFSDPRMKVELRNKFAVDYYPLQQEHYPENQMWINKGVLYVSVHVVGSNNGWVEGDTSRQIEVTKRNDANIAWLEKARVYAHNPEVKAMVIATHADFFKREDSAVGRTLDDCMSSSDQYRGYCNKLFRVAYSGIPVLLVHGDTNAHCLDQPIDGMPDFWRLNVPADSTLIDMDIVTITPENINKPFQVRRLLDGSTPPAVCNYAQ